MPERIVRGTFLAISLFLFAIACSRPAETQPETRTRPTSSPEATSLPEATHTSIATSDGAAEATMPSHDVDEQVKLDFIKVDQFGYRPGDPKVAVIVDPEVGYNSDLDFEAGAQWQVRDWLTGQSVLDAGVQPWASGKIHHQSGDRGWWLDFSELRKPGSYYVIDVESGATSGRFEIADSVYDDVLDTALRMFWFNRANTPHPEELGGPWSDRAAFVGEGQDTEARSVDDQGNAWSALDLSGGWFDAGDTNKYVTFASEAVHVLLTAYRRHPDVFDDRVGIPESGNGIPDIVDEIRWELEWLEKMQQDNGGVLTKVGITSHPAPTVPSTYDLPRYYEGTCSSATIAAAGMFAHAAVVFRAIPELLAYSEELEDRARAAWDWFRRNPISTDCDPQLIKAGDADWSVELQRQVEAIAAIYLFALTNEQEYESAIRLRYNQTHPFVADEFGVYRPDQSDALLYYIGLAEADSDIRSDVLNRVADLVESSELYGFDPELDLYRASMPNSAYHWGSNQVKASIGTANLALPQVDGGSTRALSHLHYFHGVNPLSTVYLSNMSDFGAERSVQTLFHFWFGDKTQFDVAEGSDIGVAPGFVVGGPNNRYSGKDEPPSGQPPQKSYRDWSTYTREPDWEITEPAIYYQAAYIGLLAAVLDEGEFAR